MTNQIEVTGLSAEITAKGNELEGLKAKFQDAMASMDAAALLSIGKQIQRVEDEILTLEKRYAKITGEAAPNLKGIAATNLKNAVSESIAPNIANIRELIRTVWSLQTERKLEKIVLNFSADDVTEMPTISLVGGFREVTPGTTKSGAERKTREVSRWIVPGEDDPVGRKGLIIRFGPKYGQDKMFDKMTAKEREEMSDKIAAGEGFEKYSSEEDDE